MLQGAATAEFAAKAYLRGIGEDSFGYSVSVLLGKAKFDEDLINLAKKIGRCYIPTRYTDARSEGSPEDYYSLDDAQEAISSAETIISEVENKWESFRSA